MKALKVTSYIGQYTVHFDEDSSFLENLGRIENHRLVIDRNVYGLYGGLFDRCFDTAGAYMFDALEDNKCLDEVVRLCDYMVQCQAKKNVTIVCVGGGITQDVCGFVASTLYRGVRWVFIPTTFLAQTDSCIGSKTSLNFRSFKNLIGTFYPPTEVHIQTEFLNTLTENDFFSGIGETIKLQLMKEVYPKDMESVRNVVERARSDRASLAPLIRDNLAVKIHYMGDDEFDRGRRNLLNYGHCFGHALERASTFYVPHGIAVNIGMIFANALSVGRGMLSEEAFHRVTSALNVPNVPLALHQEHFDSERLLEGMKSDKKRTGKDLTVIVPDLEFRLHKVGDVTEQEFTLALERLMEVLFGRSVRPLPESACA